MAAKSGFLETIIKTAHRWMEEVKLQSTAGKYTDYHRFKTLLRLKPWTVMFIFPKVVERRVFSALTPAEVWGKCEVFPPNRMNVRVVDFTV